VLTVLR
ncbi:phosphopyruvate hydratase domain protein, partial [Vibrio parahaemolyticus V-223/04]